MRKHVTLVTWMVAVGSLAACGERSQAPLGKKASRLFAAVLPDATLGSTGPAASAYPMLPSFARHTPETDPADLDTLTEVDRCATCHQEIVRSWKQSGHARASFDNPWYRANVDAFRNTHGAKKSRFCAGCHDPLLLFGGTIDQPVDAALPAASAGVTCMVCHGIVETRPDGRASYTLRSDPIVYPQEDDHDSLVAHRARMAPPTLRSVQLCGTCHRAHLDESTGNLHALPGMDDLGAFSTSAYAGSHASRLEPSVMHQDCASCHMPNVSAVRTGAFARRGVVRSHNMAGGQTALAALTSAAQHQATLRQLRHAVTLDIGALRSGSHTALAPTTVVTAPGAHLEFDVVIHNRGAGHRFPGGLRDTQDTWVAVEINDSSGCTVAAHGTTPTQADNLGSTPVHRLVTAFVDADGNPQWDHHTERFAAVAYDHTIPARDARAVRYGVTLPSSIRLPATIVARLMHRRHNPVFHDLVCTASTSERGQRFERIAGGPSGCTPQPIAELASARLLLVASSNTPVSKGPGTSAPPRWHRLLLHALALTHQQQEHLEEAKASLLLASQLTEDPVAQAQVVGLQAQVAARQGQVQLALTHADRAEQLLRDHAVSQGHTVAPVPALDRVRGQALARSWQFAQAAGAFRRVAAASPMDTHAFRDLARALGSHGFGKEALIVAQRGLQRAPRDPQLLRSQAAALTRLGSTDASAAQAAHLLHREPDVQNEARHRCTQRSSTCRAAIVAIPYYQLEASACDP